jgi:hypothetical protein
VDNPSTRRGAVVLLAARGSERGEEGNGSTAERLNVSPRVMGSEIHKWNILRPCHGLGLVVIAALAVGHLAPGAAAAPRKPPPTAQPLWRLYPLDPAAGHAPPRPPTSRVSSTPTPPSAKSFATTPRPRRVFVQPTAADSGAGNTEWMWLVAGLAAIGVGAFVGLILLARRSHRDQRGLLHPAAVGAGLLRNAHRLADAGAARRRSFRRSRGHTELDRAALGLAPLVSTLPERRAAHEVDKPPEERPAPAPVADEPAVSGVGDPLRAIGVELARARSEHLAASLLLFDGLDAIDVERAIAQLTGTQASGDPPHWLVLRGVLPKRAGEIAEAALATLESEAVPLDGAAIGIAGYPRHAQSASALFRLARRALEHAAASHETSVVVARDEWTEHRSSGSATPTEGISSAVSDLAAALAHSRRPVGRRSQ